MEVPFLFLQTTLFIDVYSRLDLGLGPRDGVSQVSVPLTHPTPQDGWENIFSRGGARDL